MRSTVTAIQMAVRVVGVVQLVLGLAFWTGNALGLVDLHQLLGILLVLALWALAALAARAGVPAAWSPGPSCSAWSCPSSASPSGSCCPASAHWVIQVVHLLLGLGLLGLAENLAIRAKARLAPVA